MAMSQARELALTFANEPPRPLAARWFIQTVKAVRKAACSGFWTALLYVYF